MSTASRECERLEQGDLRSLTLPARLLMWLIVAALVVAHGCHAGDHDDEPAFVPRAGATATAP